MNARRWAWAVLALALLAPAGAAAETKSSSKPQDPRVTEPMGRGVALYRKGELVAASREFKKVLKVSPDEPRAKDYLAKIDARFDKMAENLLKAARKARVSAEKDVARLLDAQPDDAEGARRLFKALDEAVAGAGGSLADLDWLTSRPSTAPFTGERREKERRLRGHLRQAASRSSYARGAALFRQKKWEEALEAFDAALAADPAHADARRLAEKARAALAEERRGQVDALYSQAAKLYSKGDYDGAAALLEEVLRIHPLHMDAKRYLEKIESLRTEEPAPKE